MLFNFWPTSIVVEQDDIDHCNLEYKEILLFGPLQFGYNDRLLLLEAIHWRSIYGTPK